MRKTSADAQILSRVEVAALGFPDGCPPFVLLIISIKVQEFCLADQLQIQRPSCTDQCTDLELAGDSLKWFGIQPEQGPRFVELSLRDQKLGGYAVACPFRLVVGRLQFSKVEGGAMTPELVRECQSSSPEIAS